MPSLATKKIRNPFDVPSRMPGKCRDARVGYLSLEPTLAHASRMQMRKTAMVLRQIYINKVTDLRLSDFALGVIFASAAVLFRQLKGGTGRLTGSQRNNRAESFLKCYSVEIAMLRRQSPSGFKNVLGFYRAFSNAQIETLLATIENAIVGLTDIPDDIFSWLYQYLKVDAEKDVFRSALQEGKKISGEDMLPATQFFTEKYMVSHVVQSSFEQVKGKGYSISDFVIVDPACGGGNFLIEAVDVLYRKLIASDGVTPDSAIAMLMRDVIWGVEIDASLAEVAKINLFLKVYRLNPRVSLAIQPNILTCDGDMLGLLQVQATKAPYSKLYTKIAQQASIPIFLTNPPFMGPRLMDRQLKEYLLKNYPKSNGDLCLSFMERCLTLMGPRGVFGVVNQNAWMFLSTAAAYRREILNKYEIREVINLGADAFIDISGEKANVALTVFASQKNDAGIRYVQLAGYPLNEKAGILASQRFPQAKTYRLDPNTILKAQDATISPLRNNSFSGIFENFARYSSFAKPMQGTSTGDNRKFIRYAWEVPGDPDWRLVSKGGGYSRWMGLNNYKVLWGKSAEFIKNNPGSAVRNISEADTAELVYSDTGTMGLNVRFRADTQVFIASGPGIKVLSGDPAAHLGFLNSKAASFFIRALSPKLTLSAGYIGMLPVKLELLNSAQLAKWARECVAIKSLQLSRKLSNAEFRSPDWRVIPDIETYLSKEILSDLECDLSRIIRESKINAAVSESFGFTASQQKTIDEEVGGDPLVLPVSGRILDIAEIDALLLGMLGATCEYYGRRISPKLLGFDSALEELSFRLQRHPAKVLEFVKQNIIGLKTVRALYRDDLCHKALLWSAGFVSNDLRKKGQKPLDDMFKKLTGVRSVSGLKIQEWAIAKFNDVHLASFRNIGFASIDSVSKKRVYLTIN